MLRSNGNPAPLEKGGKGGFERAFLNETIMLHVNTKDNENRRRSRDRPLGLSNRKGTNLKVCPYSVVFGGIFR